MFTDSGNYVRGQTGATLDSMTSYRCCLEKCSWGVFLYSLTSIASSIYVLFLYFVQYYYFNMQTDVELYNVS